LTDHSRSALDLKTAALPVVLAGSYADRTQLLAIGLASAVADLEPYRTLAFASTVGEARRFLLDLEQMNGALESYNEGVMTPDDDWDEDELVLRERYAGGASPFDAAEYFGEQLGWTPQARLTSADWLKQCAPQVFSEFAQEDTGGGFDYGFDGRGLAGASLRGHPSRTTTGLARRGGGGLAWLRTPLAVSEPRSCTAGFLSSSRRKPPAGRLASTGGRDSRRGTFRRTLREKRDTLVDALLTKPDQDDHQPLVLLDDEGLRGTGAAQSCRYLGAYRETMNPGIGRRQTPPYSPPAARGRRWCRPDAQWALGT